MLKNNIPIMWNKMCSNIPNIFQIAWEGKSEQLCIIFTWTSTNRSCSKSSGIYFTKCFYVSKRVFCISEYFHGIILFSSWFIAKAVFVSYFREAGLKEYWIVLYLDMYLVCWSLNIMHCLYVASPEVSIV